MKGYTLIEILVGITIIGLVFGFGFVSFREFSRRQVVAGAAKQIKGDLRLAQEYALSGKKPADCVTQLDSYSFTVTSSQNPATYEIKASCSSNATKSVDLAPDLYISPAPPGIVFKALGQGTTIEAGGSVIISVNQVGTENRVDITVSASGEIK